MGIEEDEMNRGPEDHEKDSKNEERGREGSNGKGYGRRKKEQASSESLLPQTVDVILRLLQGMQDIQKNKKIVKSSGKDDGDGEGSPEVVQRGVELPKLPEPSPETGPIDFSDWLLVIHGTPSSCTTTSPGSEEIAEIGKEGFFFTSGRNTRRTEREVVCSRSLTTLAILTKVCMTQYQPEKSAVLAALESPQEAQTIAGGVTTLRRWLRWKRRAEELGVSIPDATTSPRVWGD